jgi:hypothetical protein
MNIEPQNVKGWFRTIPSFEIRHSLFKIQYSPFWSFSFDQTAPPGRQEAALTPDTRHPVPNPGV